MKDGNGWYFSLLALIRSSQKRASAVIVVVKWKGWAISTLSFLNRPMHVGDQWHSEREKEICTQSIIYVSKYDGLEEGKAMQTHYIQFWPRCQNFLFSCGRLCRPFTMKLHSDEARNLILLLLSIVRTADFRITADRGLERSQADSS